MKNLLNINTSVQLHKVYDCSGLVFNEDGSLKVRKFDPLTHRTERKGDKLKVVKLNGLKLMPLKRNSI